MYSYRLKKQQQQKKKQLHGEGGQKALSVFVISISTEMELVWNILIHARLSSILADHCPRRCPPLVIIMSGGKESLRANPLCLHVLFV